LDCPGVGKVKDEATRSCFAASILLSNDSCVNDCVQANHPASWNHSKVLALSQGCPDLDSWEENLDVAPVQIHYTIPFMQTFKRHHDLHQKFRGSKLYLPGCVFGCPGIDDVTDEKTRSCFVANIISHSCASCRSEDREVLKYFNQGCRGVDTTSASDAARGDVGITSASDAAQVLAYVRTKIPLLRRRDLSPSDFKGVSGAVFLGLQEDTVKVIFPNLSGRTQAMLISLVRTLVREQYGA